MRESAHQTVLLQEAVEAIFSDSDGIYIDGTYGRGGHSALLLSQLSSRGKLLALDRDISAVDHAKIANKDDLRFEIAHSNFGDMLQQVIARGWQGKVRGVLLDIGVSSPQLDDAERGFSFMQDGPLDMRMDISQGLSAAEWLADVAEETLANVLFEYGEERYSRRIARAIVKARSEKPITRTKELADIVAAAHPAWERHKQDRKSVV